MMKTDQYASSGSEVAEALAEERPVVALESTLIAHGLPWPRNLEAAPRRRQRFAVRGRWRRRSRCLAE